MCVEGVLTQISSPCHMFDAVHEVLLFYKLFYRKLPSGNVLLRDFRFIKMEKLNDNNCVDILLLTTLNTPGFKASERVRCRGSSRWAKTKIQVP